MKTVRIPLKNTSEPCSSCLETRASDPRTVVSGDIVFLFSSLCGCAVHGLRHPYPLWPRLFHTVKGRESVNEGLEPTPTTQPCFSTPIYSFRSYDRQAWKKPGKVQSKVYKYWSVSSCHSMYCILYVEYCYIESLWSHPYFSQRYPIAEDDLQVSTP